MEIKLQYENVKTKLNQKQNKKKVKTMKLRCIAWPKNWLTMSI